MKAVARGLTRGRFGYQSRWQSAVILQAVLPTVTSRPAWHFATRMKPSEVGGVTVILAGIHT
jgi:hypothetical protein